MAIEWAAIAGAVVIGGFVLVWIVIANVKSDASTVGTGIGSAATATVNEPAP